MHLTNSIDSNVKQCGISRELCVSKEASSLPFYRGPSLGPCCCFATYEIMVTGEVRYRYITLNTTSQGILR